MASEDLQLGKPKFYCNRFSKVWDDKPSHHTLAASRLFDVTPQGTRVFNDERKNSTGKKFVVSMLER